VDRSRLIDGRTVAPGDRLVGVPSSGLHTNGYSLARRIVFERLGLSVDDHVPELGRTVGEALLEPHWSYLAAIRPLLESGRIKAMAHITGGGITENLPRVLPPGTAAVVNRGAWDVPPLFQWLQRGGDVPPDDMMRTFNMGIGLIVVASEEHAGSLASALGGHVIGEIVASQDTGVTFS
jgi:phosphoribosylformylglycinamidine cyclo-ligase